MIEYRCTHSLKIKGLEHILCCFKDEEAYLIRDYYRDDKGAIRVPKRYKMMSDKKLFAIYNPWSGSNNYINLENEKLKKIKPKTIFVEDDETLQNKRRKYAKKDEVIIKKCELKELIDKAKNER